MDSLWKQIVDTYFFLYRIVPLSWVLTFWKIWMQSCQQNVLEAIKARALKLDEWTGSDKETIWLTIE